MPHFRVLRCVHTALNDFLSDCEKLSNKNDFSSNVQMLTHCFNSESQSYFLSDITGFQSNLSNQTVYWIGQFLGLGHHSVQWGLRTRPNTEHCVTYLVSEINVVPASVEADAASNLPVSEGRASVHRVPRLRVRELVPFHRLHRHVMVEKWAWKYKRKSPWACDGENVTENSKWYRVNTHDGSFTFSVSVKTVSMRDDASNTSLIEINGVTLEWGFNPFLIQ